MSNQRGGGGGGGGNNANRWDVMSIREYVRNGETKSQWTKVGVAFTNANGSINVVLDCLPLDGKLQLQVPLTQEERDRLFGNNTNQDRGGGGQQQRGQQQQRGGSGGYSGRQQQGNPRNAGAQQRGQAAQRYGSRGQSNPQQGFGGQQAPPPYEPDPNADADAYSQVDQESGWDINGVWITDPKDLPHDHPDYIPF